MDSKPCCLYIWRKRGGWFLRGWGTRIVYVGISNQADPPNPPWARALQHRNSESHYYTKAGKRRKRKQKKTGESAKWWVKYISLEDSTYRWIRIIPSRATPGRIKWIGSRRMALTLERLLIIFTFPMGNIQHNWTHGVRSIVRTIQRRVANEKYQRKFSSNADPIDW